MRIALQLSKECMDLLNKIFVIDSSKRISLQGIRDHPWYHMPLPEQYLVGEQKIREGQDKIDDYLASRKISQACLPAAILLELLHGLPSGSCLTDCQGHAALHHMHGATIFRHCQHEEEMGAASMEKLSLSWP